MQRMHAWLKQHAIPSVRTLLHRDFQSKSRAFEKLCTSLRLLAACHCSPHTARGITFAPAAAASSGVRSAVAHSKRSPWGGRLAVVLKSLVKTLVGFLKFFFRCLAVTMQFHGINTNVVSMAPVHRIFEYSTNMHQSET
jgi:hypothetical protein